MTTPLQGYATQAMPHLAETITKRLTLPVPAPDRKSTMEITLRYHLIVLADGIAMSQSNLSPQEQQELMRQMYANFQSGEMKDGLPTDTNSAPTPETLEEVKDLEEEVDRELSRPQEPDPTLR